MALTIEAPQIIVPESTGEIMVVDSVTSGSAMEALVVATPCGREFYKLAADRASRYRIANSSNVSVAVAGILTRSLNDPAGFGDKLTELRTNALTAEQHRRLGDIGTLNAAGVFNNAGRAGNTMTTSRSYALTVALESYLLSLKMGSKAAEGGPLLDQVIRITVDNITDVLSVLEKISEIDGSPRA